MLQATDCRLFCFFITYDSPWFAAVKQKKKRGRTRVLYVADKTTTAVDC